MSIKTYLSGPGAEFVNEKGIRFANRAEVMAYCKSICDNVEFTNSATQACEWIVHPNDQAPKNITKKNDKAEFASFAQFEHYLHGHGRCSHGQTTPSSLKTRPTRGGRWKAKQENESEIDSKIKQSEMELANLKRQRSSCAHSTGGSRNEQEIMQDLNEQYKKMQLANTQWEYDTAQQESEKLRVEFQNRTGRVAPSSMEMQAQSEAESSSSSSARRGRKKGTRKGTRKGRKGTRKGTRKSKTGRKKRTTKGRRRDSMGRFLNATSMNENEAQSAVEIDQSASAEDMAAHRKPGRPKGSKSKKKSKKSKTGKRKTTYKKKKKGTRKSTKGRRRRTTKGKRKSTKGRRK